MTPGGWKCVTKKEEGKGRVGMTDLNPLEHNFKGMNDRKKWLGGDLFLGATNRRRQNQRKT